MTGGAPAGPAWSASTSAPEPDQLITWAGPYVNFRFNRVSVDLEWLSAREIYPLP